MEKKIYCAPETIVTEFVMTGVITAGSPPEQEPEEELDWSIEIGDLAEDKNQLDI